MIGLHARERNVSGSGGSQAGAKVGVMNSTTTNGLETQTGVRNNTAMHSI
jgi:hypothetical protein